MPLDEEQFERYLKEFRPVPAESLQVERRPSTARRPFRLMAWAATCAASIVLVFLLWSHGPGPNQPGASGGLAVAPQPPNTRSLTIGSANALLSHAPSFKEAVDQLSFPPEAVPPSKGKQSALSVLGKENIKL